MNLRLNAVAIAALCAMPAFAGTQYGTAVSLSGFGTLGAAVSDNKQDAFVRDNAADGANDSPVYKVDSKLGVQADVKATPWLSGTLQVLAEQRYESRVTADFEWAFIKLTPLDGLNVRIGRLAPALFMVSDSRNVGYANTMIRMPNEVYSLAGLKRLRGGDVSYQLKIGGTSLTASGLYGRSTYNDPNISIPTESTRGFNLVWDTGFGSFRAGQVKTTNVVADFPAPGITTRDPYSFSGVGYQFDEGNALVAAEYVKRKSKLAPDIVDSTGLYVMGGWRFDSVLPYAAFAKATRPNPELRGLNGEQQTLTLGVRWDLVSGAAVKLQFDAVDPKGTAGVSFRPVPYNPFEPQPVRKKTNVVSLAVDFVY